MRLRRGSGAHNKVTVCAFSLTVDARRERVARFEADDVSVLIGPVPSYGNTLTGLPGPSGTFRHMICLHPYHPLI